MRTLTNEKKQDIRDAYQRLGTYEAVRKEYGCSYGSIHKALKEGKLCVGKGGNQTAQRKITDKQLVAAISSGFTRQEIAEQYGAHVETIGRRMTKLGVHATHAKPKEKKITKKSPTWKYSERVERLVDRTQGNRFAFIAVKSDRVRMRCKICGKIIERSHSTVRTKTVKCEYCREKKQLGEKRIILISLVKALLEKKTPKYCVVCGKAFFSEYAQKKYCSPSCKKKVKHKSNSIRKRCRRYGVSYTSGISLFSVYKRDNGICQICGKPTNWHDNTWGNGCGPLYPTIDHKTALANGGAHCLENVQLAHAICNSYKRDQEVGA